VVVAQEQEIVQKDGLLHKSNIYTLLPDTEQESIYRALLAACHTIDVLDAEQYTLQGLAERKVHSNVRYSEFRQTPQALGQLKRKVVAIDCEMVGLWKNAHCVALVCAVDVLTGETLLNIYVDPVSKVQAWRSTVSGVTRRIMSEAIEQGQALRGWAAAREALWEYIDAETIIVGHALQNDLNVLGIIHPRIVDTAILASQAVFPEPQRKKFPESYGLKRLLLSWLNMTIQMGKKGHDCLEDTLATRELAIWCARNPEVLKSWGSQMRVAYETRKLAIQQAREEAKRRAKEDAKKDAKNGAEKVAIADVKENVKQNSKQEARKDLRKDAKKDVSNDGKKDTK
jgi:DNA polymerase III epsilon subunit-like protein